MNRTVCGFILILGVLAAWAPVRLAAQWTTITPGVEYQVFNYASPQGNVNVYVTRMDRSDTSLILETGLAQGKINGGTETVRLQAERYNDAISLWGNNNPAWGDWRGEVVAAINGDYNNYSSGTGMAIDPKFSTDAPQSGQVIGGWYAKRFRNFTGGSGMAWQMDRDLAIGGCVNHQNAKQVINYPATAQSQNLTNVNAYRGTNEIVLYTPQFDARTGTDNSGVEVLVQMARPTVILPSPSHAAGTVVAIYNGAGNTPIPFDHVVLSATGSAATTLLANVSVGSEVRISQEITHYQTDCSTSNSFDWTKTYASMGGANRLVTGGVVSTSLPAAPDRARTAFGYDATHAYLMVMERFGSSQGMDFDEMADFCANTLNLTDALAQDGGGSSTMWVDGSVVNTPEFTTERAIFNTIFIVKLHPKEQTTTFTNGETIYSIIGTSLRTGPGNNHPVLSIVGAQTGTIVAHDLNGVRASNANWWRVSIGGTQGWAREDYLTTQAGVRSWDLY